MRKLVVVALSAVGFALVSEPVLAIPAFARRYKVECHFCHDIYPKLNLMGQRFKERGFRMEREEDFDAAKWLRSVPLTVRASGTHSFEQDAEDSNAGFFKGISAGNLGSRLAYWVDDSVLITEGEDSFTHLKPNNAWGRVEIVRGNKLYAKGGRFELDVPFTQVRTPHLFGYEIYFSNTGSESDSIARYQQGVEMGGEQGNGFHWSAAFVQRVNRGDQVSDFGNVYLRAAKRFTRNRVGGFAYFGKSQLGDGGSAYTDGTFRLGADADLYFDRLNLYGVYMYGHNDNSTGEGVGLSFHGGFLQGDYRLGDAWAATLRANFVDQPVGATSAKEWQTSLFPGVQVWLLRNRLKLSFEYGFLDNGRSDYGAVQAEVAF